jgi:hypothetical protein
VKLSARCKGDGLSHSVLMGFHHWVYLRVERITTRQRRPSSHV